MRRLRTNITRELPKPNPYAKSLDNEFRDHAFNEERTLELKSLWREKVFKVANDHPMDLEIGTGIGLHFAHRAAAYPERSLVGIELKYKPLIQTIRLALGNGSKNAAVSRFHAFDIDLMFAENELNDVFIHFPDPWTSPKKPRNRVVCLKNLDVLHNLQRPGSFIEFKTDSREYFLWALEEIAQSKYKVEFQTLNLYKDGGIYLEQNYPTAFEKIFVKQGIEINYIKLIRS